MVTLPSVTCSGPSVCAARHLSRCSLRLAEVFRPGTPQVIRPEEAGVLYSLVFGEGVMNDATSVAILRAVQARCHMPPSAC